jgi:hypothetical protein
MQPISEPSGKWSPLAVQAETSNVTSLLSCILED